MMPFLISQGRHRRDLSSKGSRQGTLHDHSYELASELGHRVLDTIPRELRRRQRKSAI